MKETKKNIKPMPPPSKGTRLERREQLGGSRERSSLREAGWLGKTSDPGDKRTQLNIVETVDLLVPEIYCLRKSRCSEGTVLAQLF